VIKAFIMGLFIYNYDYRSQNTMEEKIDSTTRRLETLEGELVRREREMDEMNREKTHMQKDLNNLKNALKGWLHFVACNFGCYKIWYILNKY
jgi:low affinity Fe/Cu permease